MLTHIACGCKLKADWDDFGMINSYMNRHTNSNLFSDDKKTFFKKHPRAFLIDRAEKSSI